MDTKIISTIISAAVAALTPLILYYLNRRERNQEIEKIDQLHKRLTLANTLVTLGGKKSEHLRETILLPEIDDASNLLCSSRVYTHTTPSHAKTSLLTTWRTRLLLFKPRNLKVFILQIIFFYLLISTMMELPEFIFNFGEFTQGIIDDQGITDLSVQEVRNFLLAVVSIFLLFIFVSLVWIYKRIQKLQFKAG